MWQVKIRAENTNPQNRHTSFGNSKTYFSEKLYKAQKIPHECFETYGQGRHWLFSVNGSFFCFKSYSGVLFFGIFTWISTASKKINAARLIYIRSGCKIGILSENKLG